MISQRCAHSFQSGLAATLRIQTLVGRNSLPLARVRRKRRALGPSNCTMRSLPPLMPPPHTLSGPYLLRMEADDLQWIEGRRRLGQLARREDGHLIPPSPCSPRLIAAPPPPPHSQVSIAALSTCSFDSNNARQGRSHSLNYRDAGRAEGATVRTPCATTTTSTASATASTPTPTAHAHSPRPSHPHISAPPEVARFQKKPKAKHPSLRV